MATKRMLPHTITVFTDIGEDERYHTTYSKQVYRNVYCEGITNAYSGERPTNPVTIYLFDDATTNMANFNPKGNGKEYVVFYDDQTSTSPPSAALNIRRVLRRQNGSRRMWHWEVYAE